MNFMTHALALAALSLGLAFPVFSQTTPDWENHAVFRINKEEPRATKMPFPSSRDALRSQRMDSDWAQLLNGDWKYHWAPEPSKRPVDFYTTGFDDSSWTTIPVPSNVELEGHGTPLYSNVTYPFRVDPPRVMGEPERNWTAYEERNPVSSYRRSFVLDDDWAGRQVFVVFNGVNSAFYLWVNGRKVGYSQDSRTPAEFNITPYLQDGENLMAVEVYRNSDGSYLEDQDFWRLSGIFRDVYLWTSDNLDIRDFEVVSKLDGNYEKGELTLKTWVKQYDDRQVAYSVAGKLLDDRGRTVAELAMNGTTQGLADHTAEVSAGGLEIQPWSAENPYLYNLLITLNDAGGKAVAHYVQKVGFKTVEVKDGNMLVNGQPILIKGVNRHDHNHLTGHYITEESMRGDLDTMKRLNINAVRTSHYPNDPLFLELTNEYGFYVCSEANIESHGMGYGDRSLAKDPSWGPAHLDRIRNMFETMKNQPSAIMWSMGNEAGFGVNFEQASEWLRQRKRNGIIHYEQAREDDAVDIYSPMYYQIGGLERWVERQSRKPLAEQMPMIQCEYNHTMGNSSGGLKEYWELHRKHGLLQGGFIWDWRDQSLLQTKTVNGEEVEYFAFGGDFGDRPNDDNFCCNGVVAGDLTLNPHAHEIAHQYRNILVTPVALEGNEVKLLVLNELFFETLTRQRYRWELLKDGERIRRGRGRLPGIAPQQSVEITLDLPNVRIDPQAEYHLTIVFPQGRRTQWADADHVIAREQFALPWTSPSAQAYQASAVGEISVASTGGQTVVSGSGFAAAFDDATGRLASYKIGGEEYLNAPMQLNFWRPSTDNDYGAQFNNRLSVWREAGTNAKATAKQVVESGQSVSIDYDITVPAGQTTAQVVYRVFADGAIEVKASLAPKGEDLPMLPRVGMMVQIDPRFSQWEWFGRGPWENYRDRKTASVVGVYSGPVDELWHPYVEMQETANRTDIRWSTFADRRGNGLRFRTADGQLLEMGAYPYAQEVIQNTKHPVDAPKGDFVTVHVAHAQMGVGGENSWGTWPLEQYRLPADRGYQYAFRIEPLR